MAEVTTTAAQKPTGTSGEILLETRGLTQVFGGLVAVDGVDLKVERGSITSVIGPNGAGKTTFFNMIAGIYRPTRGEIWFNGQPISRGRNSLRPDQVTKTGISRTFQNIRLFANVSTIDNVLMGMHTRLTSMPWHAVLRTKGQREEEFRSRERAYELLDYVGLSHASTLR